MSEANTQKAILDWLAAKHILAYRMNVGGLRDATGRTVRFGTPGMADILAFPNHKRRVDTVFGNVLTDISLPTWIEVKSVTGKQSALQKSFQEQVEREGHKYILARDLKDVEEAMK